MKKLFLVFLTLGAAVILCSCSQESQGYSPSPTISPVPSEAPTSEAETPEQDVEAAPTAEVEPTVETEPTTEPVPEQEPAESGEQPEQISISETGQDQDCINKAAFYDDVTIPDNMIMRPGEKFTKIWQVRNVGTCTWETGYGLVFAYGEIMSGGLANPIPIIEPGEIAEVSVDMTAPQASGSYVGNWEFQNTAGTRFGFGSAGKDYVWVQIIVRRVGEEPATESPAAPQTVEQNASYEEQVLVLINNARAENGLQALSVNEKLAAAALAHSTDMATNDFADHIGTDGMDWYGRISAQGAVYGSASENIYYGNPDFGGTPQGAFTWWMNSKIHKDNILDPDSTEIGIAYVYNEASSYGGYYTVVFIQP